MSYLVHSIPLDWRYCSVSQSVNGRTNILVELRLNSPPLSPRSFFVIQDVALPHAISMISPSADAHPFQNCSSAETKSEPSVSIQGISSMNTTFFSPEEISSRHARRRSKALYQVAGTGTLTPKQFSISLLNLSSWTSVLFL